MLGFYFHFPYTLENVVQLYTANGLVRFAAQYNVIYLLLPYFSVSVFSCCGVAIFFVASQNK